jgi:hypothetical protein
MNDFAGSLGLDYKQVVNARPGARRGVNSPGKTGFDSIVAAIHGPYRWRYDLLPRPTFATQPSQKRRSGAGR